MKHICRLTYTIIHPCFFLLLFRYETPNNCSYNSRRIAKYSRHNRTNSSPSHLTTLPHIPSSYASSRMMTPHCPSQARNPCLQLSNLIILLHIQIHLLPTLHKQLLHALHMKIIGLAFRPIRPTCPFPPTTMTSACKLIAQIKATIPIIQNFWEICTARVQIESAPPAVVHESQYLVLARVAFTLVQARWFVVEPELALLVEGVSEGKGCLNTSLVQVELAKAALVFEPDPGFFATITLEGGICELEL